MKNILSKVVPDTIDVNSGLISLVKQNEMEALKNSEKFLNWAKKISRMDIVIKEITVLKVHMFGSQLGFAHINVDATTNDGKFIPGITFIRGDSVFMLSILEEEETGIEWYVLTYQPRIAVGSYIFEIPAGMIDDDSGEVSSVALKELIEEVGSELQPMKSDLKLLDSGTATTPGALDETGKIFVFKKVLPAKTIASINNKRSGLDDEDITVKLVKKEDFLSTVQSMPAKVAFLLYHQ